MRIPYGRTLTFLWRREREKGLQGSMNQWNEGKSKIEEGRRENERIER